MKDMVSNFCVLHIWSFLFVLLIILMWIISYYMIIFYISIFIVINILIYSYFFSSSYNDIYSFSFYTRHLYSALILFFISYIRHLFYTRHFLYSFSFLILGTYFDGTTLFVNASTCTLNYRPTNPPIVIDLPLDKSKHATVVQVGLNTDCD